jgi:hypothetical protein
LNLSPQLEAIATPLFPAREEVGLVGSKHAIVWVSHGAFPLRRLVHAEIDVDRLASYPHPPGDLGDGNAFLVQDVNLLVASHMGCMALDACLFGSLRPVLRTGALATIHLVVQQVRAFRRCSFLSDGDGYVLERGPMPQEESLQCLDEVLREVKAIGDLDGIRCATSSCLAIAPSSIAADDCGTRVVL